MSEAQPAVPAAPDTPQEATENNGVTERPVPQPLDPPMVPFAVAGMVVWAVTGLVLLPFHGWLADHHRTNWLWICLAGLLLGLPGLYLMIRHDRNRRVRRAGQASGPAADADEPVG